MILFDEFGEFFGQIPVGLIINVCVSGALLFAAFAYFVYFKPLYQRRKRRQEEQNGIALASPPMRSASARGGRVQTGQLPDLDLLLGDDAPGEQWASPAPIMPDQVHLNTGAVIRADPVLSVMRDPRDGHLVVVIDDVGYRSLADEPHIKEGFINVMRELSDVVTKRDEIGGPAGAPAPMPLAEKPKPAPAVEEPVQAAEPAPPPRPARPSAPPPPITPDGKMPGDLPSYKLDDTASEPHKSGLFGRARYEPKPVPELNIAMAIEAYLQHKLRHTDGYAGREIHVHSAPGGGVRIEVDGEFFDAVSDVTDADVRSFLQETIQEWQDRN